jgi:hypothetical protein
MSSREEFEKAFSVPETLIKWYDIGGYASLNGRLSMTADIYNQMLRVWQVATALQAEEIERQAERVRDLEEALREF